jgi:putative ABC transport system permease protein
MSWWRRRNSERELDEEVEAHLAMAVRDRIERGEDPAEARLASRREFGNVALVKEATRETWRWRTVDHAWQDVRLSLRLLRRSPGFALSSIVCIACGVGLTTTIFGALNALIIRPLPYADAHELVVIHSRNVERQVVRAKAVFSEIGVWSPGLAELTAADGDTERVMSATISPGILRALRHALVLGRNVEEDDQRFGNHRKVLLGHGLWQRRYGGDPNIVGRIIDLAARPAPVQPHVVIGVLAAGIAFPEGAELWRPADVDIDEYPRNGSRHYFGALARLAPGATLSDARTVVATVARRLQADFPQAQAGWDAQVTSLRDELIGDLRGSVLLFQGAALLVLFIACANVANLMLARGASRRGEVAIRLAIGAGRARIVRHLLTESLVLAILGGGLGMVAAIWGVKLLTIAFPDGVPSYIDLSIDRVVLAFTTVATVATGIMFGIAPAWRASQVAPAGTLQRTTRGAQSRGGTGMRSALVALEIGLSLVLMIGAALLVRSDLAIRSGLGFDPRGGLSVAVPTPPQKYEGPPREILYADLAERIRGLPNVTAVGWAGAAAPLERPTWRRLPIAIEGRTQARGSSSSDEQPDALVHEVSPTYLDAIGVGIVRGRGISPADRPSPGNVSSFAAVVNETFVRVHFLNEDPIGRRILTGVPGAENLGTATFTIVGVARDFRQERPPRAIGPAMYVYVPLGMNSQTLTVRTSLADPAALALDIRAILKQMDPALPPPVMQTFEATVARSLWRERLHERVLGLFAALAMALAVFGVYGVIAYSVVERTHEFGVRLALGATKAQVVRLALRQGVWLTAIGVTIGSIAALQLSGMLRSVLHEVRPTDPFTFIGVSIALSIVILLAALTPARRASAVDPVNTLRLDG